MNYELPCGVGEASDSLKILRNVSFSLPSNFFGTYCVFGPLHFPKG